MDRQVAPPGAADVTRTDESDVKHGSGFAPIRSAWRRWRDRFFFLLFFASVAIGILGLATLVVDVLTDGIGTLDFSFINSYPSRYAEESGIRAALFGTIWITVGTAAFSIPIGVGTAIFLEEFAPDHWATRLVQLNIANLAGVPSIIYGMLGLALFVQAFALDRSVLAGSLTMTLLILPIVIIVSQEAIKAVPGEFRDAAFALGANRWQVVKIVVLPQAIPGIMSGIILALSRAVGEAAPMLMISSLVFLTFIPTSPDDRFTVLPVQIFNWVSLPQPGFQAVASAGIIVLLAVLLSLNSVAIWIRNRYQKRY
ncbi:MAG TPA: phosphate ABC transporter permease PstA [Dehalococcoidia bacterium]|mgnify:CR=1 FL=1|jgi:phosphate transport system permease protein|nr:phosphate ABC transporter, permease protein PstA [Chloroflexota bacterium]MDP5877232.1 phosphate ABC transporter permease PstA [Dehalococcoidia bacterium]MDP6274192.1 phosphate ABC transporter permease PstA [Dehalococcoidia bacterium]MDP7159893.1 phosphate ABC transporter permease PstA [Dehalococcoidia bacterium]MDP7212491.1 phosphate ABC transporter permease PstA [Dehalococcoidia bacterium]|tara:strand:+ start:463 stop:1398 length:936 start_codon:yes stop_codon:yes gene_type:complete